MRRNPATALTLGGWLRRRRRAGWLGIKIFPERRSANVVRGVLLRSWLNEAIAAIPYGLGAIYALVDILFIFGSEERFIHDYLAGTIVVVGE